MSGFTEGLLVVKKDADIEALWEWKEELSRRMDRLSDEFRKCNLYQYDVTIHDKTISVVPKNYDIDTLYDTIKKMQKLIDEVESFTNALKEKVTLTEQSFDGVRIAGTEAEI